MYRPIKYAAGVNFGFITDCYPILYKKTFPYPQYMTDDAAFSLWDKLFGLDKTPLNEEEKEIYRYMKDSGPTLFNDTGTDAMKEWMDVLSMAAVVSRWKKNKQVLICSDDFIECLQGTDNLRIPANITQIMPFDTFCLDLLGNSYFPDVDYAYVTVRKSYDDSLEIHISRILNDEVFFSLYIILNKDDMEVKDGIPYYLYSRSDIPEQKTIPVRSDAVKAAGKTEVDNSQFSALCIFTLQLAMYISADNKDMVENAETKKTYKPQRKLENKFSAVQKWDTGYTVGRTFRQQKEASQKAAGGYVLDYKRKSPVPHLRRGHFHLYHTGTGRTETAVRWIAPTFVNGNPSESNVAVIHRVM